MKKLILPISIMSGCVVLGWFYYASQINKQQSIERQQIIKIEEENRIDFFRKKVECEKCTSEIKNNLNQGIDFSEYMTSELDRRLLKTTESFNFVFYSPKDNSCLYSTEKLKGNGDREFFIYNALTKNKITSFKFPGQFDDYKKFILEYSNGEVRL